MSGYRNFSRSNNSHEAIVSGEMPLSMINKDAIYEVLNDYDGQELAELEKLSVAFWKFAARRKGRDSWHHTSSMYNKTDHYNLYNTADFILENLDWLKESFAAKKTAETEPVDFKYSVLEVQIWGGSRRRPRLEGTELVAGLIKGDWLYSINFGRYSIYANKTVGKWEFPSYAELVKKFPKFKGQVKKFNGIKRKVSK